MNILLALFSDVKKIMPKLPIPKNWPLFDQMPDQPTETFDIEQEQDEQMPVNAHQE